LRRREHGKWIDVPNPDGVDGHIRDIAAMPSGKLATYWLSRAPKIVVFDGDRSSTVATLPTPDQRTAFTMAFFADTDSYYTLVDGKLTRYVDGATSGTVVMPNGCPRQAVLDARGNIYFYGVDGGFWAIDKGVAVDLSKSPGLPKWPISSVAVHDADHLWLASGREGLFDFDIRNRTVIPFGVSALEGRVVSVKTVSGRDSIVITSGPEVTTGNKTPVWEKVWRIHGQDVMPIGEINAFIPNMVNDATYDAISTSDGVWIGNASGGVWYIPVHGKPRHLDWHDGLTISSVRALVPLDDGGVLAVAGRDGGPSVEHLEQWKDAPALKLPTMFDSHARLPIDNRSHLWALTDDGKTLRDWDGVRWQNHPVPSDVSVPPIISPYVDSLDRVWLISLGHNPGTKSVAIFDPSTSVWVTYLDADQAYASEAVRNAANSLRLDHPWATAYFGKNGTAVYTTPYAEIRYFDGSVWHEWSQEAISGRAQFFCKPFFDHAGDLAVTGTASPNEYATYRWISGAWKRGDLEMPPNSPSGLVPALVADAAFGKFGPHIRDYTVDRHGVAWFVNEHSLYRVVNDQPAKVFDDNTADPFLQDRHLDAVLIDAAGHRVLETQLNGQYTYIFVPDKQ
jgi:hypothetical protein